MKIESLAIILAFVMIVINLQYSSAEEDNIKINEVMVYSNNDADGEWIELYNPKSSDVDISSWKLSDSEGTWTFPSSSIIFANSYLIIANRGSYFFSTYGFYADYEAFDTSSSQNMIRTGTLTLANSGDDLTLFDSSNNIIDQVWYGNGGNLGSANATLKPNKNHSLGRLNFSDTNIPLNDFIAFVNSTPKNFNEFLLTNIEEVQINSSLIGKYVNITGVVSAPTGCFNSTIFFVQQNDFGVLIYQTLNFNAQLGKELRIIGKIDEYKNQTEIKAEYIYAIGNKTNISPLEIPLSEINNENYEGRLVKVNGIVSNKIAETIFLNGSYRIYIDEDTEISLTNIEIGDNITFIGILYQYDANYSVNPRFPNDLTFHYCDLFVKNVYLSSHNVIAGQNFEIYAEIFNFGGMNATFKVKLLIDGENVSEKIESIEKGKGKTISFSYAFNSASSHLIEIIVNPNNETKENNLLPNSKNVSVEVAEKNIGVSSFEFSFMFVFIFLVFIAVFRTKFSFN